MKLGSCVYPPFGPMKSRDFTILRDIIVHHTDGNPNQTPLEIDSEEREHGKYSGVPYTFLIAKDGTIFKGRPIQYENAANYGRNPQSISIAVIGAFHPGTPEYSGDPSPQQVLALMDLTLHLHQVYPQIVRTIGHRDIARMFYPDNTGEYATACPGDSLYGLLPALRQYIQKHMKMPPSAADATLNKELQ